LSKTIIQVTISRIVFGEKKLKTKLWAKQWSIKIKRLFVYLIERQLLLDTSENAHCRRPPVDRDGDFLIISQDIWCTYFIQGHKLNAWTQMLRKTVYSTSMWQLYKNLDLLWCPLCNFENDAKYAQHMTKFLSIKEDLGAPALDKFKLCNYMCIKIHILWIPRQHLSYKNISSCL
jgi:hypothetical protein